MGFIDSVRESARSKIIYTDHALTEMLTENEVISIEEIRHVVFTGDIIEDYPADKRGHSCLMFAYSPSGARPVHVVCAPKGDYCAIITAYVPSVEKWYEDYRTRRNK